MKHDGVILLADGTVFAGELEGAVESPIIGEVVFNTGMVGYQEVLTDPSYAGQIVTMTFPLIGNYGIDPSFSESTRIHAKAVVSRELWGEAESRGYREQLAAFLCDQRICALTSVDTRALTRHIRREGEMPAVIGSTEHHTLAELATQLNRAKEYGFCDLVSEATGRAPVWYRASHPIGKLAIIDLGLKKSMPEALLNHGYSVIVLPATTPAHELLQLGVDGFVISNGPGNPEVLGEQVKLARALIGRVPVFGIGLGQQILAIALGAKTYKLKFGHRGSNHPVHDLASDVIAITTQNHGYAVAESGLTETGLIVTHRNLNDGTIEGIHHQYLPIAGIQFDLQSCSASLDTAKLIDQFIGRIRQAC